MIVQAVRSTLVQRLCRHTQHHTRKEHPAPQTALFWYTECVVSIPANSDTFIAHRAIKTHFKCHLPLICVEIFRTFRDVSHDVRLIFWWFVSRPKASATEIPALLRIHISAGAHRIPDARMVMSDFQDSHQTHKVIWWLPAQLTASTCVTELHGILLMPATFHIVTSWCNIVKTAHQTSYMHR